MRSVAASPVVLAVLLGGAWLHGAEEWEAILEQALKSDYSQTRQDGLKSIDTTTRKGLRALWKVLSSRDGDRFDWYVREGAYEALTRAEGPEAEEEIRSLLRGRGNPYAKEAIVYSVIWKLRKEYVKREGGNDDRRRQEAKYKLRKTRGLEYFALMLPVIAEVDPEHRWLEWIRLAFEDANTRVRRAAIHGFLAYPHESSVPLLLKNLKEREPAKKRHYAEWLMTRHALEQLTGHNYGENVEDWHRWWEVVEDRFSLEKRVEEELEPEKGSGGPTRLVRREGVEVRVKMKVAGKKTGYPLLVLPWHGFEVDYFRPYFHGVEDEMRVYYVQIPQIEDFKGLPRHESNLVIYPTEILARALGEFMEEEGPKKFALLGHGPDASTLAMWTAAIHPGRVTHMVLINPRSAGSVYADALQNLRREGQRRGSKEIVKGVDNVILGEDNKPTYEPADAAEAEGNYRAIRNLLHADPTRPEIGTMEFLYRLPGGTGTLNDSRWSVRDMFSGQPPRIPVLIFAGEKDAWTPVGDILRVAGFLRGSRLVRLPQSGELPFVAETYTFTAHLKAFFRDVLARQDSGTGAESSGESAGKSGSRRP